MTDGDQTLNGIEVRRRASMLDVPVIHVGVPKSATTSLEENLFEHHPGILNVGRPFRRGPARRAFYDALADDPASYASEMRTFCEREAAGRKVVFCDDNISSLWIDNAAVPEKLYAIFGPSRILLTTRSQITAIPSLYLQYSDQDRFGFAEWVERKRDFVIAQYDFARQVRDFSQVFGDDNVKVIPFEDLVQDVDAFATSVCEWIGVDPLKGRELMKLPNRNPRMSDRELKYLRFRSLLPAGLKPGQLLPRALKQRIVEFLQGGTPAKLDWSPAQKHSFEEEFRQGNRWLSKHCNRDFGALGYPV
jgi:hypothetical protein